MYGISWFVAFAGLVVLASRFDDLLPDRHAGLLWGSLPVFVTAVLYMSGGAVWRDRHQFGLGVWLSLANVAGLVAGPGGHSLVICVAGGGGLLFAAGAYRLSAARPGTGAEAAA